MFNQAEHYMKPESKTIRDLLKNSSFSIPDYQRAFAWSVKGGQLGTLWTDLTRTEAKNFTGFQPVDKASQKPHFTGAVVTEIQKNYFDNYEDVIDGQQRLITFTILISVLCDFVQQMNEVNKRQGFLNVLQGLTREQGAGGSGVSSFTARVKLNQEHEFFVKLVLEPTSMQQRDQMIIQTANPNRIQIRIVECVKFFSEKLNGHFGSSIDQNYDFKVERFINTLLALVTFLEIKVIQPGLAYTIFETLNTRGLDLAQADLIKNDIYRRAQNRQDHNQVMDDWKVMLSNLPDKDKAATNYIRHYYISTIDDVKATDLFTTVSEHLQNTTVLSFSNKLKNESVAYSVISGDSTSGNSVTDNLLEEITEIIKVTACYPLLLSAASILNFSSTDFQKIVKVTRDFCFRFFTIGGESVARLEQVMGDNSRLLRSTKNIQDVIDELQKNSPSSIFTDDFNIYEARQPVVAFYIVRKIEEHLAAGAGMQPFSQSPQQHLEHIMPKKPTTTDWGHVFGNDKYDNFLHRVGNLLVLEADINRSIKNKSFSVKIGTTGGGKNYQNSALKLPTLTVNYLNASGLWDFSSIESRQKALSDEAIKVWSLK